MTALTREQEALIHLTKALSNPTRLSMLIYLSKAKMAMCGSFTRMMGVPQPQASRNLKMMTACGLVCKEKIGKTWIYTLNQVKWEAVQQLWSTTSQY